MPKTLRRCFLLLLLIPGLLPAAVSVSGPIAGYVADPSRPVLRVISGVPGSYLFSDPIPMPDGVTRIHLSPGKDFALIESGAASPAILFLSAGAVDHVTALSGAMPAADWVAFSASAGVGRPVLVLRPAAAASDRPPRRSPGGAGSGRLNPPRTTPLRRRER